MISLPFINSAKYHRPWLRRHRGCTILHEGKAKPPAAAEFRLAHADCILTGPWPVA